MSKLTIVKILSSIIDNPGPDSLVLHANNYGKLALKDETGNVNILANQDAEIEEYANDYQLVAEDSGKHKVLNNSSNKLLTIPTYATVPFKDGTRITFEQKGNGKIVFTPAVGVTLKSLSNADKTAGINGVANLMYKGSNTWLLWGDITT